MLLRNNETMAMVKVEVASGKDLKTKTMAQKLLDQGTENARELKELLGGGL
jgi:ferritin-like protein